MPIKTAMSTLNETNSERILKRLFRDAESVHLHFEEVIDADAVDAVGLRPLPRLRHRLHDRAVDEELDFVRQTANFERIGGSAARVRLLHRVAHRFRRHAFGGSLTAPELD